jgi:hypothetical protein
VDRGVGNGRGGVVGGRGDGDRLRLLKTELIFYGTELIFYGTEHIILGMSERNRERE